MNIHDKAVKNMIEGYQLIGIQSLDESSGVRITRTCEICGGSTESLDNHVCEYCRESIRKLFREHRIPVEDAFLEYVEETIDKYSTDPCYYCSCSAEDFEHCAYRSDR